MVRLLVSMSAYGLIEVLETTFLVGFIFDEPESLVYASLLLQTLNVTKLEVNRTVFLESCYTDDFE